MSNAWQARHAHLKRCALCGYLVAPEDEGLHASWHAGVRTFSMSGALTVVGSSPSSSSPKAMPAEASSKVRGRTMAARVKASGSDAFGEAAEVF